MRRLALLAALICLPLAGCGVVEVLDEIVAPGGTFQVRETRCVGLGGEEFVLHFVEVLSDDRCPEGETCDRPGEARLSVHFLPEVGDPIRRVFDIAGSIDASDTGRHTTVEAGGFRVALLQLDPNPTGADPAAPPVATFRLLASE